MGATLFGNVALVCLVMFGFLVILTLGSLILGLDDEEGDER